MGKTFAEEEVKSLVQRTFRTDLYREAAGAGDTESYVSNQEALLALARVDFEKARPLIMRKRLRWRCVLRMARVLSTHRKTCQYLPLTLTEYTTPNDLSTPLFWPKFLNAAPCGNSMIQLPGKSLVKQSKS